MSLGSAGIGCKIATSAGYLHLLTLALLFGVFIHDYPQDGECSSIQRGLGQGGSVLHAIGLWLFCFGLWLLLSGYFEVPLLLILGALSGVLVVFIAWRTEVIDPEERPLRLRLNVQMFSYWPWLFWQVVLANLNVAKRIIDPQLPISPTLVDLKPSQRSDLGRVIYANSITLTPGTVTVELKGEVLQVHALTREGADALRAGDMDRRVARLEGVL